MKYNFMLRATGSLLNHILKQAISDPAICKNTLNEYKAILTRAKDIGGSNRLLGSYALAAYFIAMNRNTHKDVEENYAILEQGLKTSKAYKALMGDAKSYFSEKNMASRREWSKETYKRHYENDWVVDVIEKGPGFEFGFDYHECGVCKLCRDEHCFQYAKYLCRLDYMTTEMMGIGLKRTKTLGDGDEVCDFRFYKK